MYDKVDQTSVNTIRTLGIDAIEKAGTGHPGIVLGAAPMIYALWTNHMNINPKNSNWFNRDRFVLSAGHGSILLYTMLHLSGYDVSMEDIKKFREIDGLLAGHPECDRIDGVEATTGPLGQGVGNGVGMAMAEKHLAGIFNKDDEEIIDHYTYVLCGDGDLQEGVSHEACSLAGHLKLNKLIMLYDSNDVQLDGPINKAYSDDIKKRFEAYHWDYQLVEDGNDMEEISKAIEKAKQSDKPSLIEIKTVIGFGSPKGGTSSVHGSPLGEENISKTKEFLHWNEEKFFVPGEVYKRFEEKITIAGKEKEENWNKKLEEYGKKYPEDRKLLDLAMEDKLKENWNENLTIYDEDKNGIATRDASGKIINEIANELPTFWGGSADLSGSNKTTINNGEDFSKDNYSGKNIWFGVREFAMGTIVNGIQLHGGTKSFGATFFVFSDYLRPSIRVAALSKLPVTYVFSHDSIAVGADGPTHEPIEQLASFRAMPNVDVIRPADANETRQAWEIAVESKETPTLLVLSRQKLPVLKETKDLKRDSVKYGGYVISEAENPEGILIASGSEVSLALEVKEELKKKGHEVSVVSMPSMYLFDEQSDEYKEKVLPKNLTKRLAIEMGSSFGWHKYVGDKGKIHGIDRFGLSGDEMDVQNFFGFNVENIVNEYLNI